MRSTGGVKLAVRLFRVKRQTLFWGLAAVGLAVAIAVHTWGSIRADRERSVAARAQIRNLEAVLDLYQMDNGAYPTTKQGLRALEPKSEHEHHLSHYPKGFFARQLLDPWGRPFEYRSPGVNNSTGFDLWSLGADGIAGGSGSNAEISNWEPPHSN